MQAMPSLCAEAGVRCATRSPLSSIEPPSGWCAPVMALMSVDLPAPFSPSSAWTSPACKLNETPLRARTAPKDFVTAVSWRSGASILAPLAQNVLFVTLDLGEPRIADGHALLLAVVIPDRAERHGLGFLHQSEARGV